MDDRLLAGGGVLSETLSALLLKFCRQQDAAFDAVVKARDALKEQLAEAKAANDQLMQYNDAALLSQRIERLERALAKAKWTLHKCAVPNIIEEIERLERGE